MSNINIKRAVENIRTTTTVYTPVVEVIVNALQAIDDSDRKDGKVLVRALRASQARLDSGLRDIVGFEIVDNGIGFTDEHLESFDTLYTDHRIEEGGKGFGRFTCLKYFDDVRIRSDYRDGSRLRCRSFTMGHGTDIVVNEKTEESECTDTRTTIRLHRLRQRHQFDKKLSTVARNLVERLLPYFIVQGYDCPSVVLSEQDDTAPIVLNALVGADQSSDIQELQVETGQFSISAMDETEDFEVRVFKFYAPRNQRSRISLVAHKRDVSGSALYQYIPEFEAEFYDPARNGASDQTRNYIVRAYVFGDYLDRNVSLERGGFEFSMQGGVFLPIGQAKIERKAANIARTAVGTDISLREEKKRLLVVSYVDEQAPWHKAMLDDIDLSELPSNPTDEAIEILLHKEKFAQEATIKRDVAELLESTNHEEIEQAAGEIVQRVSDASKNELTHYIALRRKILDVFDKSLQLDDVGKYSSEGVVHDVIFPRRGDTERTAFERHNLWILDERLNYTSYVSSDRALNRGDSGRPDLLVYNRRVLFRGDNEPSNPITIFEFKKPQRDDFVNPSSGEDPVDQIIRYANEIRDGKHKTPEGREVLVADTTPFYGFVVCDLTPKVRRWLDREKDFRPMPDGLGWFQWRGGINLYVEVISWDKVLKDAQMRNRILFEKLGI
jgi:hypothetical protein